jgi:hypothetical protein
VEEETLGVIAGDVSREGRREGRRARAYLKKVLQYLVVPNEARIGLLLLSAGAREGGRTKLSKA